MSSEDPKKINQRTEAQEANNEANRTRADILKELTELEEKNNDVLTRRKVIDMEYLDRIGKSNAARKAAVDLVEQLTKQQAALTATEYELAEAQEKLKDTSLKPEERVEIQKDIDKYNKSIEEQAKLISDQAKELESAEKILKKYGKISKEDQNTVESLTSAFEGMTFGLISATAAENNIITKTGKMIEEISKADDITQVLSESFGGVFNMANIAAEIFDEVVTQTIKMATEFDAASAEFSRATGLGKDYNDVLFNVQKTQNQFGITAAEAGQSMQSLLASFSEFHSSTQAVQQSLAAGVAQLGKLGVSADETSKLMQTLSKTINISGQESLQMAKEVGMMGVNIGISTKKMLSDYNASLKTLAVYGEKSVEVFKNIAAAAKAAGVETGVLLGLAEKFDTFAGAAETTGKLNALLGSQLSATEMLLMTEDQRLKTMISTVQATGQSFASLDKFTQKAIANAAGISDMAEANKIFGMSLSEYENYEQQMAASADAQKKLEEAMKAAIPFTQKLKIMAAELAAAFLPVLEGMHVVLDFVTSSFVAANEASDGLFGTILGGIAGVALFLKSMEKLSAIFKIFNFGIIKTIALKVKDKVATMLGTAATNADTASEMANAGAKKTNAAATELGTVAQAKANVVAKAGVGTMLALGAAIMMIGAGIGAAAFGMAEFVKAFAGFSAGEILAVSFAIGVFAASITAMILVLMAFVTGPQALATALVVGLLLSVGAAALMIGKGIKMATDGMANFTNSLADLKEVSGVLEALSGAKNVAVNVILNKNLDSVRKFISDVKEADIKSELENLALITTGVSANMMTENTVASVARIESLAKEIKNVFKPEINVRIEGDDVRILFEDGVYKVSRGTG